MSLPPDFDLDEFVERVLAEDLGKGGDVTSNATIAADARFTASMNCRQEIVVAGLDIAAAFFRALDSKIEIELLTKDGNRIEHGTTMMRLAGNARAMLAAERSALNTLQHLSGIATLTRRYVDEIAGTGAVLLDTRKTIPGLRTLEKYASRMGARTTIVCASMTACSSRTTMSRSAAGSPTPCAEQRLQIPASRSRSRSTGWTRSSRRSLPEPTASCSTIWTQRCFAQAVAQVGGRAPLEASGGVTLETIRFLAETGVNFISVGRITQSAPAVDIGLDYAFSR